jgi:hypothetical protein
MLFSRTVVASLAVALLALAAPAEARADEASGPNAQLLAASRSYYDAEVTTSFSFVAYGAVTAGAGAVSLTQSGDFAHGFGWTSLIAGGVTALGGAAYGVAARVRGNYYTSLAEKDPAQFKREESERIAGTNQRFALYLGSEIAETIAGIGIATYGFAAKSDLAKGIGVGAAIQGIGLFVIDAPGAGRAARYRDDVHGLSPQVGVSVGGGGRPWAATLGHSF